MQAREKEEKKLKAKQKETARLQVATFLNEFGAEIAWWRWVCADFVVCRLKQLRMDLRKVRRSKRRRLRGMKTPRISLTLRPLVGRRNRLHLKWLSSIAQVQLKNRKMR